MNIAVAQWLGKMRLLLHLEPRMVTIPPKCSPCVYSKQIIPGFGAPETFMALLAHLKGF